MKNETARTITTSLAENCKTASAQKEKKVFRCPDYPEYCPVCRYYTSDGFCMRFEEAIDPDK